MLFRSKHYQAAYVYRVELDAEHARLENSSELRTHEQTAKSDEQHQPDYTAKVKTEVDMMQAQKPARPREHRRSGSLTRRLRVLGIPKMQTAFLALHFSVFDIAVTSRAFHVSRPHDSYARIDCDRAHLL